MKIAVVTGASSGMGREAAVQIAGRFPKIDEIWLIARRMDRLQELEQALDVPVRKFEADLLKTEDRDMIKLALAKKKPEVKLLINAAGFGKIGRVGSLKLSDETAMVRLNCEALCAITHIVLPYMPRNSRIMQFASSAAFLPQPKFAIYAATKSFVLSYSRALACELRKKRIYVTAVCPGPVKTEFFDIAETTGKIPLYKRLAMADPKKVVSLAFRDSMWGKSVSIYGPVMKAFFLLCKILPHGLILKMMEMMQH
ncbi:MAG: SDR family NAD(P)-dependent oxidoreductase [Clostridiaceae bacterium]|nr:SDR family NAD(P)-dependent oxidoreductase [Clostridiaceae bacterium]